MPGLIEAGLHDHGSLVMHGQFVGFWPDATIAFARLPEGEGESHEKALYADSWPGSPFAAPRRGLVSPGILDRSIGESGH